LLAGDFALDGCPIADRPVIIDAASSYSIPRLGISMLIKRIHETPGVGQNCRFPFPRGAGFVQSTSVDPCGYATSQPKYNSQEQKATKK
jgi:hypothetical protein